MDAGARRKKSLAIPVSLCYNFSRWQTNVHDTKTNLPGQNSLSIRMAREMRASLRLQREAMGTRYFVVKEQAVPEVLLKVVEAKKLLDTGRVQTVNEAADKVGISRSSFYKYKDDVFQFHDNSQGVTITLTFQMEDEPGLLSEVLKIIAGFQANILTIHQSIPINGVASLSLSVQVLPTTGEISDMVEAMERHRGVRNVRILAKA